MKIFVSSTYIDLVNHRLAVKEAIEKFGYQFWGMELFSARHEEPKTACFDEIDKCQMLIGIYGCRYGSIPDGDSKSITHQEYEYACKKMPCLCFKMDSNQREKCEEECERQYVKITRKEKQKLDKFLKFIAKHHVLDQFTTPDNLGWVTTNALKEWTEGKRISIGEYMNFVIRKFEEIKTLSTNYYRTKDNDFYINLTLTKETRKKKYDQDIVDVFSSDGLALQEKPEYGSDQFFMEEAINQRKIVVLGATGSGKTTLLRHLAYRFARNKIPQKLLPLYFNLNLCGEKIVKQNLSFAEIINNQWSKSVSPETSEARKNALINWINTKRCIFLFDGLDEVGQHHNEIIDCIENLSAQMEGDCYIVITSRPVGFEEKLSMDFIRFKLKPIEERQIRQYLNIYFRNEENKAIKLWNSLKSNISIKALATNPFLLTIIAYVGDEKGVNLFKHRFDLYKKAVNKLLKQREIDLSNKELSLLEEVAYHFFKMPANKFKQKFEDRELSEAFELIKEEHKTTFDFSPDKLKSLLKDTETKSGLFIQVEEGIYAFLHPSFQEYLSACAIAKRSDRLAIVESTIWEDRWEEVLRFLAARISNDSQRGRENIYHFFRTILRLEDDIFNTIICRLAKCASDCWGTLPKNIQREIRDKLFALWFRKVKYDVWMDESALYTLANVDSVSFDKLVRALYNEDDDVRRQATIALGNTGHPRAVDALLKILENDKNPNRKEAINSLGKIPDERAISPLVKILKKGKLVNEAANALSQIGGEKVRGILLSTLKESNHAVLSQDLFGLLLQIGIEDIALDVSRAITYPNGQLKGWLSSKLSAIDHPKVESAAGGMGRAISASRPSDRIPKFQRVLSSGSEQEKIGLLNNIQQIIGSDFSDFLGKFLKKLGEERVDSEQKLDQMIENDVEENMETLGAKLSVQNLTGALLTTSNEGARAYCVKSLGEISSGEAYEGLLLALKDESDNVKIEAVQAFNKTEEGLRVLASEEGLKVLTSALDSEKVKKAMLHILGKSLSKQASKILIETLISDPDNSVRRDVAEALGRIGDSKAVPYLLQMLEEENDQVREYSAQSLGQIGGHHAIEALYQRLQVEDNKWVKSYIWKGIRNACIKGEMRLFPDGKILGLSSSASLSVKDTNPKELILRICMSEISADRLSAALKAIEAKLGISPQDIEVYHL